MNYEMNCITMHKCTEMYSKRPEYTGECQSCFLEITLILVWTVAVKVQVIQMQEQSKPLALGENTMKYV